jgi:hypothetical protein
MNYWDSVGRWINTLLVFIVGVLAFDALFRLLEANEANVIVALVRGLAVVFLMPFQGMFGEQDYVLTTLIGVLGYSLLAGIALGVLRSLQASRAQPAPPVRPDSPVVAEPPTAVPQVTEGANDAAPAPADRTPDRADNTPRTPAEQPERPATPQRPEGARTNGWSRTPRTRPGSDGAERTHSAGDGRERIRRGRPRDRAAANRGGGPTSEADTGT